MPQYKCYLCNRILNVEDGSDPIILYKNHKVHTSCFNKTMNTITKDKQQELKQRERTKKEKAQLEKEERIQKKAEIKPIENVKDALSEEEYQAKKQYYGYLREQLGDIQAKHYAITEKYIKQFSFTFSGMYKTLIYIHDVLEKTFDNENGNIVSLIPYYYEETEEYYTSIDNVDKANKDKNINEMYKVQTVKVKREKPKRGETWDF